MNQLYEIAIQTLIAPAISTGNEDWVAYLASRILQARLQVSRLQIRQLLENFLAG